MLIDGVCKCKKSFTFDEMSKECVKCIGVGAVIVNGKCACSSSGTRLVNGICICEKNYMHDKVSNECIKCSGLGADIFEGECHCGKSGTKLVDGVCNCQENVYISKFIISLLFEKCERGVGSKCSPPPLWKFLVASPTRKHALKRTLKQLTYN